MDFGINDKKNNYLCRPIIIFFLTHIPTMKNLRLFTIIAASAVCASSVANDYLTDEVFGDPVVEINGSSLTYEYPDAEEGIWDLFMDANMWRNQSKSITYYAADGTVIEASHIGAWDNNVNFNTELVFTEGQYIVFAEGIFQIDVFDDEGETYEKYYSPAYTYKEDCPVSINSLAEQQQGVIYNVLGMRQNKLQQGINVVNGRKVMVK